jgi:hypothetical protein
MCGCCGAGRVSQAQSLGGYELLSANDCPERDPAAWRLEGVSQADWEAGAALHILTRVCVRVCECLCPLRFAGTSHSLRACEGRPERVRGRVPDAGRPDAWTELDVRRGVAFSARHEPLRFCLPAPSPPLRRVRLRVAATRQPHAANSVQLSGWALYGPEASGAGGGAAAAAAGSDGSTAAGAAGPAELLRRVLQKVVDSPHDAKYRKVRCRMSLMVSICAVAPWAVACVALPCVLTGVRDGEAAHLESCGGKTGCPDLRPCAQMRASKLAQILQAADLRELLLRVVGFRPWLLCEGGGEEDAWLVLAPEAGGRELEGVRAALAALGARA